VTLRLVPLDCPACGSAMRGDPWDTLFLCPHCGSGGILGKDGLETVESTALLPAPGRRADLWRPAWILEADVTVSERMLADGRPTPGSSGRRTFILPAFDLALNAFTRLAAALTASAGATGEVPHEPVTGGVLGTDDALVLARHLVLAEEIGRSDVLGSIRVSVDPVAWRLAAIPFQRDGGRIRCAVTGTRL